MMENKNLNPHILVCIAIVLLFACTLQFSFAASIDENTTEGINGTLNSPDFDGIMNLATGNYIGENNTNIVVNKNVTFQGEGPACEVVINGFGDSQLFYIEDNVNVKFINITFANANSREGAAIFNAFSSNITFINCIFRDNYAVNGGAIYNNEGKVIVEDSIFTFNRAGSSGGAIYNKGDFDLINSNFSYNTAFIGGAIYNSGDMDISNCNLDNNRAIYYSANEMLAQANQVPQDVLQLVRGGDDASGLGIDDEDSLRGGDDASGLGIDDEFFPLIKDACGGAIYNEGTLSIDNTNFTINTASFGGAIYNSGDVAATNCNFIDNHAYPAPQGVLQLLRDEDSENLEDGYRINRAADDAAGLGSDEDLIYESSCGGAIYNKGTFTLKNSNLTNNTASFGGAIYNSGDMDVSICNLDGNSAFFLAQANRLPQTILQLVPEDEETGDDLESGYRVNRADDDAGLGISENLRNENSFGGAIYNCGIFTLVDSNLTNNTASFGGAIYNSGNMDVSNCNLSDNHAVFNGILNQEANEMLAQDNQLAQDAIRHLGEDDTGLGSDDDGFGDNLESGSRVNRAADDAAGLAINAGSYGGAIYNCGTFTLVDSNLTNNTASFGGAIYNCEIMNITNCNFTDNRALLESPQNVLRLLDGNENLNQEVLRLLDDEDPLGDGNPLDDDNRLGDEGRLGDDEGFTRDEISRYENSYGGAIYNHKDGVMNVIYSTFDNNNANFGGAIFNDGLCNVTKSNFTNNTANFYGGAIFNSGNMTVTGNIMTGNLAGVGIENLQDAESRIRDTDMAKEMNDFTINQEDSLDDDDPGLAISEKMRDMINRALEDTLNDGAYGHVIYNMGNMGTLVLTYLDNSTKYVENGQDITLYATLTDDMSNPVTGGDISFMVNGELIGTDTSVEGYASVDYTANFNRLATVNGEYDGHDGYSINDLNGQLKNTLATSTTILVPSDIKIPALAKQGNPVNITGVFTDENGRPVANVTITVTIDGKTSTTSTDDLGRWTVSYTPTHSGNITVIANFTGNQRYDSHEKSYVFAVTKSKVSVTVTTVNNPDGTVTVTANVVDDENNPVRHYVDFYMDGKFLERRHTNDNGIASINVPDDGEEHEFLVLVPEAEIDESSQHTVIHKPEPPENKAKETPKVVEPVVEKIVDEVNTASATAAMKNTGIPLFAVFLVFVLSLGVGIRKRK